MEVPELGRSAASERAEENKQPEVLEAATAFLVIKNKEGIHAISLDINVPVTTERQATLSEVKASLHSVLDDLNNQETASLAAQNIIMHQMQMAQRISEAQANQQLLNKLPKNLAS